MITRFIRFIVILGFALGIAPLVGAQGVTLSVSESLASPGSTVFIEADLQSGVSFNGCSLSVSVKEATAYKSGTPQFTEDPIFGSLAKGGLLLGASPSDGSYNAALALSVPAQGPGTLFLIQMQIPSSASLGTVYQLTLTDASAINDNSKSIPVTLLNGLLIVASSGSDEAGLTAEDSAGYAGSEINITLHLGHVSAVGSLDFVLNFSGSSDRPVLKSGALISTALTENSLVGAYQRSDGSVHVIIADASGLSGPGDIAKIPLSLPARATPGQCAVTLSDVSASQPNGQPISFATNDGILTILPPSPGALSSLQFEYPVLSFPTYSRVPLRLVGLDDGGNSLPNLSPTFAVEGSNSDSQIQDSKLLTMNPGAYHIQATDESVTADAYFSAFEPESDQDIFSPSAYHFSGDLAMIPVYFRPPNFATNLIFDLTIASTDSKELPILERQPLLYSNAGNGYAYAQSNGTAGSYRVWTFGLSSSDLSGVTWLLPLRMPSVDPGAGRTIRYELNYSPISSDVDNVSGGAGEIVMLSPSTTRTVQIDSPSASATYAGSIPVRISIPEAEGGLLYAKAWLEGYVERASYLDANHTSGEIKLNGVPKGDAIFHYIAVDRLGRTRGSLFSLIIGDNPPILGDLNGDGKVDVEDAELSLRISIGLIQPTSVQKISGDANQDGALSVQDTILILRAAIGLLSLT